MPSKVILTDPTPGQRISHLHCWIATYADGSEGVIAYGFEGPGMMPLISSRRAQAEAMEPLAYQAKRAVADQTGYMTKVRLVTFARAVGAADA